MHRLQSRTLTTFLSLSAACGGTGDDLSTTPGASTELTGAPAPMDPDTVGPDIPTGIMTTTDEAQDTGADPEPTTTVAPGLTICGDGIVQGAEQCDAGYIDNQDENACTSHCKDARCGDGFVQASEGEACDDGGFNQTQPGYGQCSRQCQRGPHCGDGEWQKDHEDCEPGQAGASCTDACTISQRILFISSEQYTGQLGGLKAADDRCDALAAAFGGQPGTFKAWLLLDGQDLTTRFSEYDDIATTIHFTTTDAVLLAASFKALIEDGPQAVIATEKKTRIYMNAVWTNVTSDGLAAGGDCDDWKLTGSHALRGDSGHEGLAAHIQWVAERAWTSGAGPAPCSKMAHLYCIQVSE